MSYHKPDVWDCAAYLITFCLFVFFHEGAGNQGIWITPMFMIAFYSDWMATAFRRWKAGLPVEETA